MRPALFSPQRLYKAFGYSVAGLIAAAQNEPAFREEIVIAFITIPLALFLQVSALAKALLIASILLILVVELINSAIEAIVDRISLELHPLAKRAKDVASAAVFISLLNAAVVWLLILFN